MKPGKQYLKITGIVLSIILLLFASLFALAKIVITPERVKKTVLPLAQKALHRQVQLGEIKIGIFSGIVLKGLVIAEKEGNEPFIKAEAVTLKYQLLPLLSKRVIVDEIRIDSPRVRVIRMADGSFNYSDIVAKKEPKEQSSENVDLLVTKVALSHGELLFEDRSGGKASTPFKYSLSDIEFSSKNIAPDRTFPFSVKAKIPGATLALEGNVTHISTNLSIDANLSLTEAELKKIIAGLPAEFTTKAKPYDPAGSMSGKLHLSGALSVPKQLLKDGEINLDKVTFNLQGTRPVLAGKLALKGSASSGNFILSTGEDKLQINFTASNLLAKPIILTSDIKSERFVLAPFIGKEAKPAPAGGKQESEPLNLPVRAHGSVSIGQTSYKGLPVTGLLLKYKLTDNILTVDQLSGNVAGGSFSDTARIDLGQWGFVYSTKIKLQGIQADKLVSALSPGSAGKFFGTLALNADLSGKGTQSEAIKNNLTGSGDFNLANGKLTGSGLILELAQFLNLEQLRTINFNSFAGKFRIGKGRVFLDSGISGSDVQITPKGSAGFDKSLDLSLTTRLSPQLAGRVVRGEAGRFLADEKGWSVVPIKVTGTFSSPKFLLDPSAVAGQIKAKAREKLQQTIEEKFLNKNGDQPRRPEQDLLEKGLKGIFGK